MGMGIGWSCEVMCSRLCFDGWESRKRLLCLLLVYEGRVFTTVMMALVGLAVSSYCMHIGRLCLSRVWTSVQHRSVDMTAYYQL